MRNPEDQFATFRPGVGVPARIFRPDPSTPGDIASQSVPSAGLPATVHDVVVQVPAPEIAPPTGSLDVIRLVTAQTVGVNDQQPLFSADVPAGMVLIVRAVDLFVDDMVNATNVTFDLLFRGGFVNGWNGMQIFAGVAARVSQTFDQSVIRLVGAGTFSAQMNNIDGGAHQVGAGFQGYLLTLETYRQYGGKGL